MSKCNDTQSHVHEFLGSTRLALLDSPNVHNHRFAGVTGEAIRKGNSHIHKICTRTDFFISHYHFMEVYTGPAIPVGDGRHVHFVYGVTSFDAGHDHEFIFATLIEDPIFVES